MGHPNNTKVCSKCSKDKPITSFSKRKASADGLQRLCKDCSKIKNKQFYTENKKYFQDRYASQKEIILIKNRKWNKQNKDKIEQHKLKFYQSNPSYYSNYAKHNKEKIIKNRRNREKIRTKTEPLFRLKKNYRNRLYDYYRGTNRSKRSEEIVGLSWIEFKIYIENKFLSGMTWDNYGEWHIDHIIPLCSASNGDDLEKLFHYSNCQPLWKKDNISKGGKIIF